MTFRAAVRAGASALALAISPLGLAPAAPARATTVPLSDCANPDNGDPRILGLTLGQSALDVRTSPAVLGVSVTAVDTGGPGPSSGVDGVTVWFHGPGESRPDYPAPLTRDPGGTWRVGVTFPPGVAPGVWRPRVSVQDAAGLVRTYDGDALAALGLPSQLVVTSTPDTAAPRLIRLTLSRHSVDTRLRRENVTVTARTTEDPAGIRVVAVDAFGPTRSQHLELRRVSLAGTEVVWRGVLTFPRWSGTGLSRLHVAVGDAVGNTEHFSRPHLVELGLPGGIRVRSGADRRAPRVRDLRVLPGTVDVTARDASVVVRLRAADGLSGVSSVRARLHAPEGDPQVTMLRRVSGTRRDGAWRGSFTVRRCVALGGSWWFDVQSVDGSGRHFTQLFQAPRVEVQARDNWPPYAERSPDATGLSLDFSEDVVGVTSSGAVVQVNDATRARVDGSWSCLDADAQDVDCTAGPVRGATFTPTAGLGGSPAYGIVLNPEGSLDVRDLAGNPFRRYGVGPLG